MLVSLAGPLMEGLAPLVGLLLVRRLTRHPVARGGWLSLAVVVSFKPFCRLFEQLSDPIGNDFWFVSNVTGIPLGWLTVIAAGVPVLGWLMYFGLTYAITRGRQSAPPPTTDPAPTNAAADQAPQGSRNTRNDP